MNLSILDADFDDPRERLADYIVSSDEKLFRDLVAFRKARGLSQQQVADLMGIDKSNVSRLESGVRDVQLSTLRRYAMALDVVIRHDLVAFDTIDNARKAHEYSKKGGVTSSTPQGLVTRQGTKALIYA